MAFVAADPGCNGGPFMLSSNGIGPLKTPSKVPSDVGKADSMVACGGRVVLSATTSWISLFEPPWSSRICLTGTVKDCMPWS